MTTATDAAATTATTATTDADVADVADVTPAPAMSDERRQLLFDINADLRNMIIMACADNDGGDIDAEAADCIVQCGLFGAIVYGGRFCPPNHNRSPLPLELPMTRYHNTEALHPFINSGARHVEIEKLEPADFDPADTVSWRGERIRAELECAIWAGGTIDHAALAAKQEALAGWYWWALDEANETEANPDGAGNPIGPFAYSAAARASSQGREPYERARIEAVFTLTGGELCDEPLVWADGIFEKHVVHYHYDGCPEWAYEDFPDGSENIQSHEDGSLWEYRTLVVCEIFGEREAPPKWERVKSYRSSGEAECPWCGPGCDEEQQATRADCPICEGTGIVCIGEGWREVVIRRPCT